MTTRNRKEPDVPEGNGSSLASFAGEVKHDMDWLEQQPEWDEIIEGWRNGISVLTIHRWLVREKGYSAKALPSEESLRRRLRNKHAR